MKKYIKVISTHNFNGTNANVTLKYQNLRKVILVLFSYLNATIKRMFSQLKQIKNGHKGAHKHKFIWVIDNKVSFSTKK